jgi:hypothetical protein
LLSHFMNYCVSINVFILKMWDNKKYHSFGTVRNPIKNRRERSKIDTGSTHLYDRALSVVSREWQVGDVPWAPLEGGATWRGNHWEVLAPNVPIWERLNKNNSSSNILLSHFLRMTRSLINVDTNTIVRLIFIYLTSWGWQDHQ